MPECEDRTGQFSLNASYIEYKAKYEVVVVWLQFASELNLKLLNAL